VRASRNLLLISGRVAYANARKPTPLRGMDVRQLTEISRYSVRASRNLLLISGGVVGANAKKPIPQCGMGFLIYL
jgi:hypothetical protein